MERITKNLVRIGVLLAGFSVWAFGPLCLPASCVDSVEEHRVVSELKKSGLFQDCVISVDALSSGVMLEGQVSSAAQRRQAESIARAAASPRRILNRLSIEPQPTHAIRRGIGQSVKDANISIAVSVRLMLEPHAPAFGIDVDTYGGVVTLKGIVNSRAEKALAGRVAAQVVGGGNVKNRIVVDS